jgi:ribonuclease-3
LAYEFQRPELLRAALTHPSALSNRTQPAAYERLEFLGDRVLGLVVAEMLYHRFPNENEGELARRHAALVCRESLARVGEILGLDRALFLGRSEEESGRSNAATLADVCEGVLGAVYADGGLPPAAAIIRCHWESLIAEAIAPPKDAKTALQEWAQARGKPLPRYETSAVDGPPHEPSFLVTVTVEGLAPASGRGNSKRVAERLAAETLLRQIES